MDSFEVIALATLQRCLSPAEKTGVTIQIRPTELPKRGVLWNVKLPATATQRDRRKYGFWLMDRTLKALEVSVQDVRIRPNFEQNPGCVALFTDSDAEIEAFKRIAAAIRESEAEKIEAHNFMVVRNPAGFCCGQISIILNGSGLCDEELGFKLQNYFQHWDEVWIFDSFIVIADGQWKSDLECGDVESIQSAAGCRSPN